MRGFVLDLLIHYIPTTLLLWWGWRIFKKGRDARPRKDDVR